MESVRGGEPDSLAILFERHHRTLFRFFVHLTASPALAEDLAQEVFFRMLKFRRTWSPGGKFTPWMYQIARNVHVDHLRRKAGTERPLSAELEQRSWTLEDPAPGADVRMERSSDMATLRRALARLPVDKREVLVMSRYQNLKYEEIAGILGCEVGTVKQRVFRAVRQLSDIFFQLSNAGRKAI